MHQKECAALPKQPTPRKGTETHTRISSSFLFSKQPTPRKGTETGDQFFRFHVIPRNNPHPARGRKRQRAAHCDPHVETTHTPQGDGNQQLRRLKLRILETTHTPQGDGNMGAKNAVTSAIETTHTPQGDGNPLSCRPRSCNFRNNPHPARGRKLGVSQLVFVFHWKQPTPRKGTETCSSSSFCFLHQKQPTPRKGTETPDNLPAVRGHGRNNPHPARGRKPIAQIVFFSHCVKQPTPRKGTETTIAGSPFFSETTHTPQGDGNRVRQLLVRHRPETTHTPQGDGKPFVFTLQKLLEKPFTSPTGDN